MPGMTMGMSVVAGGGDGALYSPAKDKAATRNSNPFFFFCNNVNNRSPPLRRTRQLLASARIKVVLPLCFLFALILFAARAAQLMGWNHHASSSTSLTASRAGYTVLINTWQRNPLLKQAVAHYASCSGTDAVHVVWSESDPPSESLIAYLKKIVLSKSQSAHKPNFRFDLNEEDYVNNRFKPIADLRTEAIFSVDDDVIVPCSTMEFAFSVWQSASNTMVGFVPRMHWLDEEKDGSTYYKYGGWWSVWWMGTYSMVLSKAAFFHKKNCEEIAMSLLVANATRAPPIWVQGKIYEIGASGISSLLGHNRRRNKCLNDFISLYGSVPLVPTHVKAVHALHEWFW
ncbi:glycosyltransferase family 64 protein C4 isoform X2 [Amborella trichopoda]|uniref:glycosyltransferase family 64 protein C4 isoform X2 n=1 Tax=Amborella trichopoda TaxID=13333 RepID=UPI0009BEFFFA|nr:glycosyltransferase family 64 protein C4 isoform X2 [Amborella trichopoda]|eukprot:XP_020517136.1 glycosyltransferase family 64 protein C4 isoform X2 [Amborella trichopoda]